MTDTCSRRQFIHHAALLSAAALWPAGCATVPGLVPAARVRRKEPALVRGAFFYPPADVVLAGQCEDSWAANKWFTWPGNQFEPEAQQRQLQGELVAMPPLQ